MPPPLAPTPTPAKQTFPRSDSPTWRVYTGGGPPVRPAVPLIKDYVIPKYDWTKAHAKKRLDIDAVLLDIRKTKSSPKIKAPIFKVRGKREVESMVPDGDLLNFLLVMSIKSADD